MNIKINYAAAGASLAQALRGVNTVLEKSSLGSQLIDLVFLRVSQINGCAYCVDKHARDLLASGETFQRINNLLTWREVDFYTPRERAALALAESVTMLATHRSQDEAQKSLDLHFNEQETVDLVYAIALMNAWNRIGISFRMPVREQLV